MSTTVTWTGLKADCGHPAAGACTSIKAMGWRGGGGGMNAKHIARVLGQRAYSSGERQCECTGAYSARVHDALATPGVGVRSGQREVSDTCIDEHGSHGSTPSASARRCVEQDMT
ncbi:hypothetical protein B0H13DRAFT_1877437 [Mycena leptocephala]|nr:hypothetical protein B0H13DRAFT_1877437 [Mycena leptocephala]